MFRKSLLVGVLGLVTAGSAFAQSNCPCGGGGSRLNQTQLSTLLSGNTACAVLGTEKWQEWHNGTQLFELGPNFTVPDLVGSWSIVGTGANTTARYNYGTGGTYDYAVCQEGPWVHFCGAAFGGRNIFNASVKPGKASCGF